MTETMNGLITIRTQNIDRKLCHEFDELQSVLSSVSHLSISSLYFFGLYMDIVAMTFTACVTYSSIFLFDSEYNNNNVIDEALQIFDFFQTHLVQMLA